MDGAYNSRRRSTVQRYPATSMRVNTRLRLSCSISTLTSDPEMNCHYVGTCSCSLQKLSLSNADVDDNECSSLMEVCVVSFIDSPYVVVRSDGMMMSHRKCRSRYSKQPPTMFTCTIHGLKHIYTFPRAYFEPADPTSSC